MVCHNFSNTDTVSVHMHILIVMYVMKGESRIHDETAGGVSSVR